MVCGRGPSIGKKVKEEVVRPVADAWKENIRPYIGEAATLAGAAVGGPVGGAIGGAVGNAIEGGDTGDILKGGAIGGAVGGVGKMLTAGSGAPSGFALSPSGAASAAGGALPVAGEGFLGGLSLGGIAKGIGNVAGGVGNLIGAAGGNGLGGLLGLYGDYRQGEMTQDAIRDSARLQYDASMAGIDEQRAAREQLRQDLQPYQEFGQNALGPLAGAVQGEDFGRSAMIGGAGNPLLSQAVQERQSFDPMQNQFIQQASNLQSGFDPMSNLSPQILQNPLLKAMQEDITRRLMANQAARGKLGSGGTAESLQRALIPQALSFGQMLNETQRQDIADRFGMGQSQVSLQDSAITGRQNLGGVMEDIRQRDVNNLFNAAQVGGNAAAQQGQAGLNVASNIGNLQQTAAGAQTFGNLGQAANRGQMIGQFQNYFNPNYRPTLG